MNRQRQAARGSSVARLPRPRSPTGRDGGFKSRMLAVRVRPRVLKTSYRSPVVQLAERRTLDAEILVQIQTGELCRIGTLSGPYPVGRMRPIRHFITIPDSSVGSSIRLLIERSQVRALLRELARGCVTAPSHNGGPRRGQIGVLGEMPEWLKGPDAIRLIRLPVGVRQRQVSAVIAGSNPALSTDREPPWRQKDNRVKWAPGCSSR